jgi:hypothetical protein
MILLLGTNDALLEGLAQLLAGTGQHVAVTRSVEEAEDAASRRRPLLFVVERAPFAVQAGDRLARIPLAPGGAVVVYRATADTAPGAVPRALGRCTIAELELPLERNRLAALATSLESRAEKSGRLRRDTPPEHRI